MYLIISLLNNAFLYVTNSETKEILLSLEFFVDDVVKLIRSLDQTKAHGHDEFSISLIKIYSSPLSKPWHIYIWFVKTILKLSHSPKNGKKANIIPVHKKGDKQLITDYWQI